MRFEFTPDEAKPVATTLIKHYLKMGMKVRVEKSAWPDAPYRTTIVASKGNLHILVEAQGVLDFSRSLKDFSVWVAAQRYHAVLYLATHQDTSIHLGVLHDLKKSGVGLLIIDGDTINEEVKAKNPALIVNPDPTLKYGPYQTEVNMAVRKFNDVDRKDGLRDMCELVERVTDKLLRLGIKKSWVTVSETAVDGMDWSTQINTLASQSACSPKHTPLISDKLKNDFHSFRGARNLIDHKAKSKYDDSRRQIQFAERMMQGPRLISDLNYLLHKVN